MFLSDYKKIRISRHSYICFQINFSPKIHSTGAGLIYSGCEMERESEREKEIEKGGGDKDRAGEANLIFVFFNM